MEHSNLTTTVDNGPDYKKIAGELIGLMQAGKDTGMDQATIRNALDVFGAVATSRQNYGNACSQVGKVGY